MASAELFLGEGPRTGARQPAPLRQPGAGASGHARHHPHLRRARRRDDRKADVEIGYLHRAFEKDCEIGSYNNAIPVHRPAQLRLAADQQLRLRRRRREAPRHRGHRALPVHPRDHERDLPDLRPPHLRGRGVHGARRLHRLPLHDQGPRVPLGARGGRDRRAAHHLLRARGRGEGRSAGGLRLEGEEGLRRGAAGARGGPHPRHRQPDLHGPDGGRGGAVRGGRRSPGASPARCCAPRA